MEKEQIVKALECCVKTQSICDCEEMGCPALTKQGCQFYLRTDEDYEGVIFVELIKEALSLIREQEKRIEELENICESYALQYGTATDKEVFLKKERADTVRKMQEMLLAKKVTYGNITFRVVPVDDIDQIANKLMEGTE